MASESLAKKVFEEARKLYEGGFKSANKRYDDDPRHISWWKRISGKAEDRNATQPQASVTVGTLRQTKGTILQYGKYMYDMHVPAGNCGDLAQLACYLATRQGAAADQLALVSVYTARTWKVNQGGGLWRTKATKKEADHAFAVYGDSDSLTELASYTYDMVTIQVKGGYTGKVFAIDPWANLVCPLHKYPAKAEAKMRSWGSYGKRVLWVFGSGNDDYEWCQPDGEYLEVFKQANLGFNICS
jgi:hypothetical protein